MNDRAFIDTNVLVYAVSSDLLRGQKAQELLLLVVHGVISSQVVAEFISVCLKKRVLPDEQVWAVANEFMDVLRFVPVEAGTIRRALEIRARYGFTWWDSLLLSSALEAGCSILYTEDLQDGQLIEGKLRITNTDCAIG